MNSANRSENKNQYSTWSTYIIKSARLWGNPRPTKPCRRPVKATLAPSIAPRNTPAPSPDPPNLIILYEILSLKHSVSFELLGNWPRKLCLKTSDFIKFALQYIYNQRCLEVNFYIIIKYWISSIHLYSNHVNWTTKCILKISINLQYYHIQGLIRLNFNSDCK